MKGCAGMKLNHLHLHLQALPCVARYGISGICVASSRPDGGQGSAK